MTALGPVSESCSLCGQIFTANTPGELAKILRTHNCPKVGIASGKPVEVVQ